MPQDLVRCPYCVLDSEFRPMYRKSKKTFVCVSCGHTAVPEEPRSKCSCSRCRHASRVANQLSRERPTGLAQAANS